MSDTIVNPQGVGGDPGGAQAPAFDANFAIAELQKTGHAIFQPGYKFDYDAAESDPFLRNVKADIVAKKTSLIYEGMDKDIFESTGIPKNPGEKTYEYQKRAAAQLRDQIKQAPDVDKVKKDYETQLSAKDQTIAEISLVNALTKLKLNVPDESLEFQRELLTGRALSLPHRIEGRDIVFQKRTDEGILVDVIDTTTGKPMSPDKYLAEHFKMLLKVEQPAPQGTGKTPKPADTNTPAPKTRQDLIGILKEEGVVMGGPDFMAKLKAKATEYAISITE